jgi:dihydroorotase
VLTCIGSDHAPHTLEEKARPYPDSPSGIPGVQTILPLLLTAVRDGWLRLEDVARVAARAPALVYGIAGKGDVLPGFDGDLVVVDPQVRVPLPLAWLHSRAGYSPYEGLALAGWPREVVLRGRIAYRDHGPLGAPSGQPLRYG